MTILPPYLKKGDTIGIVCPAGFMPYDRAETCIQVLQDWGFNVKVGKTLGNQHNYFSGTDEVRLHDLQVTLDDDCVQAVLCGRGGYGLSRIIDQLDFGKFVQNPKWVIGFSDITLLHSHIYHQLNIATLHAPMAAAFNNEEFRNEYVQSLRKALIGEKAQYNVGTHSYNQFGKASGALVGGNLALLAHAIGTPSDFDYENKILFLEDIGEYIYCIDRMMYQLKRSGKLRKLAGLIFGGFTQTKDTTIPFGVNVEEVLKDIVKDYDFPVCFDFPVSHNKENFALKIGVDYKLEVGVDNVVLKEI